MKTDVAGVAPCGRHCSLEDVLCEHDVLSAEVSGIPGDANEVESALGFWSVGGRRALAPLTVALKDPDEQVREAAAEALRPLASKP